jgi:protein arginine N-methyltransferase 1
MFAAKAGAKKVIGIECAGIINQARQIVKDNGFENVITLVKGKVEEVELPDGITAVDIIISEWMGYFLLYESMLDTVLYARDKWLRPGGAIFPDKASLFICAIEDAEYRNDKIDFWDNVYGFDMSCIKQLAIAEPLVDCCDANQVMSNSRQILDVDIYTVKKEELDFESKFELKIDRNDFIHALVAYFDVDFKKSHHPLRFSTGPRSKYTHWKQTVFYLDQPIVANAGEVLHGTINVKRNAKNPRDIDITIAIQFNGKSHTANSSKLYRLR